MLYSRSSLAPSTEPQLMYVLLDFHAAQAAMAQAASSANFCLVLDRSTSMQGERMDQVKAAAIEFVRQLRPEDSLSIVTFSDRAEVLVSAEARIDRKTAEARIHTIQTGGSTEMLPGLAAGLSELHRCKGHSVINNLILLTDGRTYGDERACLELADRAAEQGVRINGLGIGVEWNDIFLDDLSTRTGEQRLYLRAGGSEAVFQERLNNRSQIYAERCRLNIRPAPGVDLSYVFRQRPTSQPRPAQADPFRLDSKRQWGVCLARNRCSLRLLPAKARRCCWKAS
jgi:Ca-activated chloride channel family protein